MLTNLASSRALIEKRDPTTRRRCCYDDVQDERLMTALNDSMKTALNDRNNLWSTGIQQYIISKETPSPKWMSEILLEVKCVYNAFNVKDWDAANFIIIG